MSTPCPICSQSMYDLFALASHVADRHPDDMHCVNHASMRRPLSFFEQDLMDAIESSRRAAPKPHETVA